MKVLQAVLVNGRSLSTAKLVLPELLEEPRQRSLAMELVNGVLRWRFRLESLLAKCLGKPLRKKDVDVQLVLLLAFYELTELNTPEYAVVNEAVAQAGQIRKQWAAAMINAVLRGFIRDRDALLKSVDGDAVARLSHPQWLIDLIRQDWPDQAEQILEANNQRPPMWLRINLARVPMADYLNLLDAEGLSAVPHPHAAAALRLASAVDVSRLPGFNDGLVSVQDAAAQLAAPLLDVKLGERVLDLCAAPGGKTCHILEMTPNIDMTAVELKAERMQRVRQNLERLGLKARVVVGDATDVSGWWDRKPFDRILVDAPCSASGVIRRHPDIKSLRQPDDLDSLTEIQRQILLQAWRMLRPGGVLLYVTCSVFKRENQRQIETLLSTTEAAEESVADVDWGLACSHGRQLLPGESEGDGFYFARLKKHV
ncbi:MAG: 16S rRNA (cytosine(967)-C(5))-methyltransferase RsmB [Gammaproteobacteria bacterium]|nr:16S rRNA (cytosine(967)-C(5))-methyltransferase RsmB [Gammaproteobacteria bacterium]